MDYGVYGVSDDGLVVGLGVNTVVGSLLVLGLLWCGVMEGSRISIDLPECESELVSGYVTENAGLRYGLLASTEYCIIVIVSLGVGGFNGAVGIGSLGLLGLCFFGACMVLRLTWPRVRLLDLMWFMFHCLCVVILVFIIVGVCMELACVWLLCVLVLI